MSHHILTHVDSRIVDMAGLFYSLTWAVGTVYVSKTIKSIRQRGFRPTLVKIKVRMRAIVDLLMPQTIWGEQIGLRPIQSSLTGVQVEQVYNWSTSEEVLRWSGGKPSEQTLDEFRRQIRRERWRLLPNQRVFYIMTRTGEFIGRAGLFTIDWVNGEAELGIAIGKEYWSQHYGREAIGILLRYVFADTPIDRVYLGTFADNVRAQRAFAACGFRMVGSAGRFNQITGEYVDGVRMEITRHDYQGAW